MSDFRKYDVQLAKAVASAVQSDYMALPELDRDVRLGRVGAAELRDMMLNDLELSVRAPGQRAAFPALRRVLRTQMNVEEAKLRGGMGQWAELATAIAGAASGIVGAKITADANKDLAKLSLQQQTLALQAAQLQANTAKIQLAQAQGFPSAADGETPSWVTPVAVGGGVAVLATILYFMTRRRGR